MKKILPIILIVLLSMGIVQAGIFDWFKLPDWLTTKMKFSVTEINPSNYQIKIYSESVTKTATFTCPTGSSSCELYQVTDDANNPITPQLVATCLPTPNPSCSYTFNEVKSQLTLATMSPSKSYSNYIPSGCPSNAGKCQLYTVSGTTETLRKECNPGENCQTDLGYLYEWKGYAISKFGFAGIRKIVYNCPSDVVNCKWDFKGTCNMCSPSCTGTIEPINSQIVTCGNPNQISTVYFSQFKSTSTDINPVEVNVIIPDQFVNGYGSSDRVVFDVTTTNMNNGDSITVNIDGSGSKTLIINNNRVSSIDFGILTKGWHTINVQAGGTTKSQRVQILSTLSEVTLTRSSPTQSASNIVAILTVKDESGSPLSYDSNDFQLSPVPSAKYDDGTSLLYKQIIDDKGSHRLIFSGDKDGMVFIEVTVTKGGYKTQKVSTTITAQKNKLQITLPSDFPGVVNSGQTVDLCVLIKKPDGTAMTFDEIKSIEGELRYPTSIKSDIFTKDQFTWKTGGKFCIVGYKFSSLTSDVELYTFLVKAYAIDSLKLEGNSLNLAKGTGISLSPTGGSKGGTGIAKTCKDVSDCPSSYTCNNNECVTCTGILCSGITIGNLIVILIIIGVIFVKVVLKI